MATNDQLTASNSKITIFDVEHKIANSPYADMSLSSNIAAVFAQLEALDIDFTNKTDSITALIAGSIHDSHHVWISNSEYCTYDDCTSQASCCLVMQEIIGNIAEFDLNNMTLIHGQRYRVCATSNDTDVDGENAQWTVSGFETCSDGFIVDSTPPTAGMVSFIAGGSSSSIGSTCLLVKWHGFEDLEESNYATDDGIAFFNVMLGK